MTPHAQGCAAAKEGQPHTACPFPKPDRSATGDDYPGDWANWMGGWIVQRGYMGQDAKEACIELHAFMEPARRAR